MVSRSMKIAFQLKSGAAMLFVLTTLLSSADGKWWDSHWTIRKKIEIDTTTSGFPIADQIGSVAILLRLHDGNFRFSDAKEDGSDIRFIASDDKTPLAYHIEKFDGLLNEAFVWVNVPDLKPGAKTTFWLYYGNAKASRADDAKSTYDVGTTLVYHFADQNAPLITDRFWVDVFVTARHAIDGVHVHPPFVCESGLANPRLARIVTDIGNFVHELR